MSSSRVLCTIQPFFTQFCTIIFKVIFINTIRIHPAASFNLADNLPKYIRVGTEGACNKGGKFTLLTLKSAEMIHVCFYFSVFSSDR